MEDAEAKVKVDSPALRFSGSKGAWREHRLDEVCEKIQDGTHFSPPLLEDGPYKYISARNIRNGEMLLNDMLYVSEAEHKEIYKRSSVRFGDVLLTKDGASTGNVCLNELEEEFSLLSSVAFIRGDGANASSEFIYQYLFSSFGQREVMAAIAGQAITRITLEKLRGFKFRFPTLPEQQKIAAFLGAVDRRVRELKRKQALLEQYKKGVVQKLFSQELRFKRKDGGEYADWEERGAGELFRNHSNKKHNSDLPILAATQDRGMVLRDTIGIDIKSSQASISTYKIVEPGDFVISLRSFQGGIEYSEVKGICSPAYIVLKPNETINEQFFRAYFKMDDFITELSNTVIGIRDGKQITYENFSGLTLPLPSLAEQTRIAGFLMALDAKVAGVAQAVAAAQKWKKGLLQQMFV